MSTCCLSSRVGEDSGEFFSEVEGSATLQYLIHGEHCVVKSKLSYAHPTTLS